jgi:CrcB protein
MIQGRMRFGPLPNGDARRSHRISHALSGRDRNHESSGRTPYDFHPGPLGTVFINITGSFLIGFLMTLLTERLNPHPNWRFLLVVGFLGGYTTFSSFEWETLGLVRDGGRWLGLINAAGSVVLGYIAVWLGATVAAKR